MDRIRFTTATPIGISLAVSVAAQPQDRPLAVALATASPVAGVSAAAEAVVSTCITRRVLGVPTSMLPSTINGTHVMRQSLLPQAAGTHPHWQRRPMAVMPRTGNRDRPQVALLVQSKDGTRPSVLHRTELPSEPSVNARIFMSASLNERLTCSNRLRERF
jgi:hypothetical protein